MNNDSKKSVIRTLIAGGAVVAAFGIGRSSVGTNTASVNQTASVSSQSSEQNTTANRTVAPKRHSITSRNSASVSSSSSQEQLSKVDSKPTVTEVRDYVLNTSSHKIHLPDCSSVSQMLDKNKETVHDSIRNIINGDSRYSTCGNCLKGVE